MQLIATNPTIGQVTWDLPENLATKLDEASPEVREAALNWMRHQVEGFGIALIATHSSERLFKNFGDTIRGLVIESVLG